MRYWASIRHSSLAQGLKPRLLVKPALVWTVNTLLRIIISIILNVDAPELKNVPQKGPLLLAANHLNFLDAPVLITELVPRPLTGLVKKETWENPLMAFLFNVWEGIPIDRTGADFEAFRTAKQALQEEKILAVAPEGTRSEDGLLKRGKPGIVLLAGKLDIPILPVAYYGHENFNTNIRKFTRTPMHIRVGRPFRLKIDHKHPDKAALQSMADAIMLEVAALMPIKYHGVYTGFSLDKENYIEYLDLPPGEHVPEASGK